MPKYSSRHYEDFARLLGEVAGRRAPSWLEAGTLGQVNLAKATLMDQVFFAVVDLFANDNPAFDRKRFMDRTVQVWEKTLAERKEVVG